MPFINDPQGRQEVEKVSRRLKLPVWKSICKGEFRKWWNEWWDKIDTFAETIEAVEIKAGTGLKGGGNLTENRTLSLKEATKTDLGGIIIGENLTYNPVTKAVDGNPTYTHPTTEGNKHIPAGGAAGNIILWGSSGTGTWGKLKYTDIVGTPTSLKNPYSLTLQFNGINQEGYNGEAAKTINITPEGIKAAEKVHKHSKKDITDLSLSKPLTIKFNGTSQGEYTGEVAKEIDITPAQIGAEVAFNKNSAFNKNFGTTANTILDGAKLAETLGIPYGGSLNNTNAKTVGTAYYDSTTKKTYKCTIANSLNYADNNYYEAISNNDLLVKLQNLFNFESGNTSTAMWLKLPNELLIQWSTTSMWGTFTYPKPFKDMNYVLIAAYGNDRVNWSPNASSPTMFKISATQGNIYSNERVRGYWLAIGY